MEMLARDSLAYLTKLVKYDRKKFYNIGPEVKAP